MRPKFFECSTVQNKNPDQKPWSETHTIQASFRYYLAKSIFRIHAHIYYQKQSKAIPLQTYIIFQIAYIYIRKKKKQKTEKNFSHQLISM